jgi:hypothetical protein
MVGTSTVAQPLPEDWITRGWSSWLPAAQQSSAEMQLTDIRPPGVAKLSAVQLPPV